MLRLIQTYFVDVNYSQNHAHMLHKHSDVLEILYIDSGEGRYKVGKREYAVASGDIVICNAGVIHGEAPFQKHTIQTYCCGVTEVFVKGLPPNYLLDSKVKPVINMQGSSEYMKYLMKTIHEIFVKKTYEEDVCQHLAQAVFLMVQEKLEENKISGKEEEDQKKENLIRKIAEYIEGNYTDQLTLKDISEKFYISQSSLSHLFKRETGVSPMQYVIYRRIGEAQTLLMETRLPVQEIEEKLGFGSSCHFSTIFKKYVGISPVEYRSHFN